MRKPKLAIPCTLLLCLIWTPVADARTGPATESDSPPIRIEVRSSPDASYFSRSELKAKLDAASLVSDPSVTNNARYAPSLSDLYVTLSANGVSRRYRLASSGELVEEGTGRVRTAAPPLAKLLRKESGSLRNRHYGRLLSWEEAGKLLPRRSVFTITDVETGLSFRVQRRAGSDHADVQPLTKNDTKVMSRIYKDGWSWRRRAILVSAEDVPGMKGRKLAASMNGMPHGGDGIPGNGFSGHFCVHFPGSSTHRSDRPDPIHQLMAYKAGGQVRAYLGESSPERLGAMLVGALDQREDEIVRMMTEGMPREKSEELRKAAGPLTSARLAKPLPESADDRSLDPLERRLALELDVGRTGSRPRRERLLLAFVRVSPASPWQLDDFRFVNAPGAARRSSR